MLDISFGISLALAAAQFTSANIPSESEKYSAATRSALEATYKQSGLEKSIQEFERSRVPEPIRIWAGHMIVITRMCTEQRIELKWTWD